MTGNKNSGRKGQFKNPVNVHFWMEREDAELLNEIANHHYDNSRSKLLLNIVLDIIDDYKKFNDPVNIHFLMNRNNVNILDEIAKMYTNNNRSELISATMKKVIDKYVQTK